MQTDQPVELDYFFDPLCGWCYASAPALATLAEAFPSALTMRPSGLFAGDGTRRMSSIADHAWRNGRRIAELTGQRFSQDYHDKVLRDPDARFDSTYATRAIVALGAMDAGLEPLLLQTLQVARYRDGRDTARAEVVAAVAAELAQTRGHAGDEASLATRLVSDADLALATDARIRDTAARMQALPSSDVPQLLVGAAGHHAVVQGTDLYGGGAAVLRAIERIVAEAAARAN